MKILVYGAGPIGRWLALRLYQGGQDVTLLARNGTLRSLQHNGIQLVDGLTGEPLIARVKLVDRLAARDRYELVIVAMQKESRIAACPVLAQNAHLQNVLFVGNDVTGFHRYLEYLPSSKVVLGFPGVGGGWQGDDLVILDREKPCARHGEVFFGELDGSTRERTVQIKRAFEASDVQAKVEEDMNGWLKYHFAFMAPTAGVIFMKQGDLQAVARDKSVIHLYCRACREAGDVLRKVGYTKRQPPIFNLYYWLPRWMEPMVFSKLFTSRSAEIRFGLHTKSVAHELLQMADEFSALKERAGLDTPSLDELLGYVPRPSAPAEARASAP